MLDHERADGPVWRIACDDFVPAVVELTVDHSRVLLADLFHPTFRGQPKHVGLVQMKQQRHVGAFQHERIGPGDGHFADHRVCEQPGERPATDAELIFEFGPQPMVLGLHAVVNSIESRLNGICAFDPILVRYRSDCGRTLIRIRHLLDDYRFDPRFEVDETDSENCTAKFFVCMNHRHHRRFLGNMAEIQEIRGFEGPGLTPNGPHGGS